ncbi:MAG: 30S ribosomal protein S3, partial [Candidatus Komeilibacteria bacterium CG_4_9_14_3_um_filter_37_5]
MGHKVNPKSLRLGIIQTWPSKWFARKNFAEYLKEDLQIRKFLQKKLKESGLDLIEISRNGSDMTIDITAAKPGIIIGRGGQAIEEIKKEIHSKLLNGKIAVKINIKEVENANLSAPIIVQSIAGDLEKRIPFRRVAKQIVDRVMKAGALGIKIS